MKTPPAPRVTAVALALSVCAMLLGLSHAHSALPGDVFQVARTAAAVSAVHVSEAPQGRKLPRALDSQADGQHWLALLPSLLDVVPGLSTSSRATVALTVHHGRCIAAPGCRGPPHS